MSKRWSWFTIWAWKSPRPSLTQCRPNTRKRLKLESSHLGGSSISMKQRDSLFVGVFAFALFDSPRTVYRAGLSGSIADVDLLSVFQQCPPPHFFPLKSKIDMFSVAVPPPLCFSPAWAQCRSITATCFTSCCAAHNYRGLNHSQRIHESTKKGKETENTCPTDQFVLRAESVFTFTEKTWLSFRTQNFIFRPQV